MTFIHTEDRSKHLKILNRREGLSGALRDLLLFWVDFTLQEIFPT